jgi:cytochrome c biogenesis protein CcmG/thiol:disulfide interchange protein DsbE
VTRSRGRSAAVAVVVSVVALFTIPLALGLTRDPGARGSAFSRMPAPRFSLPRLGGGERVSLSQLRGEIVILNFWASWCMECRAEHDDLAATWDRFRDRGVVLVGIPFQDTDAGVHGYLDELGGDWPQLTDPGDRVAMTYGVTGVPETVLIGPDGVIEDHWIGPVTASGLARRIEGLLGKGAA